MIGQTVSHYKIIEKIGEGGMGVVYLADDLILKRQVAIKVFPSGITVNASDRARFLQEAQAAASINHPNVCVIHEIQDQEENPFIVMEYIEGRSLSDRIASEPMQVNKVIDYAIQIADALQAAHKKGMVHRDIKPDNIMINKSDRIKVMDFGLAKLKGSIKLTRATDVVGTLAYMSPEHIEGKEVDSRSDIFSFGIVLYEMLTGQKPFEELYESALIYSILNEDPEPVVNRNQSVPVELDQIILKSLSKDPSERYQSMEDVLYDLTHLGEKSSAQQIAASIPTQKPQIEEKGIQSLVVLPLTNFSDDPKQEYFVDGMTDALITYLAKFHSIRIISRTSAMKYKSTDKSLPEIAKELNVDAVVEGSVLRDGNRVRITAQLIHAATDSHLWADNYDREFQDILLLQSEVAQAIAGEIKINLSQTEKRRLKKVQQVDPESYDAYLMGLFHWYKLSPQHINIAHDYFKLALEKDPDSALARTGIATVLLVHAYWGKVPPRESFPKAKEAVLKAIELDDTSEEAHDMLARIHYFYDWDWASAEKEFKHAIQLNPNKADVHLFYSSFLRSMGREQEAMSEANLGRELDPLNFFTQCHYVGQLLHVRQYDEAILQLRKVLSSEPGFPMVHRYLWVCYYQKQMYDEAIEEARNFFTAVGLDQFNEILLRGYANSDYAEAIGHLAKSFEEYVKTSYIQPAWVARLYAQAGDKFRALDWLETAFKERDSLMTNLGTSSDWDTLHEEQRFKELLKRMNFPESTYRHQEKM